MMEKILDMQGLSMFDQPAREALAEMVVRLGMTLVVGSNLG